nr:hypothetical protein GCM10020092_014010 [Actinoplanes digitatis]
MVVRMPDNTVDPSGNTEAFRAFTQQTPQEPPAPSKNPAVHRRGRRRDRPDRADRLAGAGLTRTPADLIRTERGPG